MLEWLRGQRKDLEENRDRLSELILGLLWYPALTNAQPGRN